MTNNAKFVEPRVLQGKFLYGGRHYMMNGKPSMAVAIIKDGDVLTAAAGIHRVEAENGMPWFPVTNADQAPE